MNNTLTLNDDNNYNITGMKGCSSYKYNVYQTLSLYVNLLSSVSFTHLPVSMGSPYYHFDCCCGCAVCAMCDGDPFSDNPGVYVIFSAGLSDVFSVALSGVDATNTAVVPVG